MSFALAAGLILYSDWPILRYLFEATGRFSAKSLEQILANSLYPLALALMIVLLCLAAGRRLLSRSNLNLPSLQHAGLALALGAGSYAGALFVLGLIACLKPAYVAVITLALGLWAWPWIFESRLTSWEPSSGVVDRIWRGLLVYLGWHALITALAPPTDGDVLAYHLPLPKIYLSTGSIEEIPWMVHSHWPHLMNLLYSLPLLLQCDSIANLLHFAAALALLGLVFAAARDQLGPDSPWLACALWASQPIASFFVSTARIDHWWALFHFLAHILVWQWKLSRRRNVLVHAGLLAGLAAATKLFGLITLLTLGAWILMAAERKHRAKNAALFLFWGLVPVAPWYLKTWIGAGNPFWPFFTSVFGGDWGASSFMPRYADSARWTLETPAWVLLRYSPETFLIPLVVAFLIFRLKRFKQAFPPFLKFFLLTGAPYLAMVVWQLEAWRMLLPYLAALTLLLTWLLMPMIRSGGMAKICAITLALIACSPVLKLSQSNELFAVLELRSSLFPGRPAREVYLQRKFQPYRFYQSVNRYFESRPAKILLFPNTMGYHLDVDYQWGDALHQGLINYRQFTDPKVLEKRLHKLGVTHVLFHDDFLGREDPEAIKLMQELLKRLDKVMGEGPYHLYALKSA